VISLPKVLITGYEPFDGYKVNPSAELAKAVDGTKVEGFDIIGKVLTLDYNKAFHDLLSYIEEFSPEVVLLCGQANRATITIERIGLNAQNTTREDNYGNTPESDVIEPSSPAAYFSTIDPSPLVEALNHDGIPANVSYHAGIYGCNWLLFKILEWNKVNDKGLKTTFVHLPPLPSQAIEKSKSDLATMELGMLVKSVHVILRSLS
jgi:pyroglutamyl-peptidase